MQDGTAVVCHYHTWIGPKSKEVLCCIDENERDKKEKNEPIKNFEKTVDKGRKSVL